MTDTTNAWIEVDATRTDADSPNDAALQGDMNSNAKNLDEAMGDEGAYGTRQKDHAHTNFDGTKSVAIGNSITWLAAPVTKVNAGTTTGGDLGWTDINISADTGADTAVIGIFGVNVTISQTIASDGGPWDHTAEHTDMRENGSALITPDTQSIGGGTKGTVGAASTDVASNARGVLYVKLDGAVSIFPR